MLFEEASHWISVSFFTSKYARLFGLVMALFMRLN